MKKLRKIEIYGVRSGISLPSANVNNPIVFEVNKQYRDIVNSKITEINFDVHTMFSGEAFVSNIINIRVKYTKENFNGIDITEFLFMGNFFAELL